jgi:hypothetical protein
MFLIVSLNFNYDLLAWSLGAEVLYAGQTMVQVLKKLRFLLYYVGLLNTEPESVNVSGVQESIQFL